MNDDKNKFVKSILIPAGFVLLLWLIKVFEILSGFQLGFLGIWPGKITGLIGIITAPLIHSGFDHLFSNSLPVLVLGTGLIYFYKDSWLKVTSFIYLLTGILVWLFARPSYHIGASGLIYGFVAFLFFSGIIRRDKRAITLALLVTFLYGSLVWGLLPLQKEISWESHIFGALSGIVAAFLFRKYDIPKRYDWEDEPEEIPKNKLEVSYKKNYPPEQ